MTGSVERRSWQAYAAALVIAMAALGLRLALGSSFTGFPFITIFPAIIAATYLGGTGPGMVALVAGGAGAWWFLVPPSGSLLLKGPGDILGGAFFVLFGAFDIWVVRALLRALEGERKARGELAKLSAERETLLGERELLLTEVRHRVGNNLQQIIGLLQLHIRRIEDARARSICEEATERVHLFAEVHRAIYQAGDDRIPMGPFLTRLVTQLVAATRPVGVACRVEVDEDMAFGADRAVPVTMITQELVANALEHGYGAERTGAISVSLKRSAKGLVMLRVVDDGAGFPPKVDGAPADQLGLGLVQGFARQLGASVSIEAAAGGRGTIAEVAFADGARRTPRVAAQPKEVAA